MDYLIHFIGGFSILGVAISLITLNALTQAHAGDIRIQWPFYVPFIVAAAYFAYLVV